MRVVHSSRLRWTFAAISARISGSAYMREAARAWSTAVWMSVEEGDGEAEAVAANVFFFRLFLEVLMVCWWLSAMGGSRVRGEGDGVVAGEDGGVEQEHTEGAEES